MVMKTVLLAVNGTLMRGLELEDNLKKVNARYLYDSKTVKSYKLYSIDDKYPAMIRIDPNDPSSISVDVEVYEITYEGLTEVLSKEPPGLSIGKVTLINGETVLGVIGETIVTKNQKDISSYGGWRNYINKKMH